MRRRRGVRAVKAQRCYAAKHAEFMAQRARSGKFVGDCRDSKIRNILTSESQKGWRFVAKRGDLSSPEHAMGTSRHGGVTSQWYSIETS